MDAGRAAISSVWALPTNTIQADKVSVTREARAQIVGSATEEQAKLSFDELYQRYYPRVLAFLRFRVGVPDVAEDLTSLVFERALLHFDDLQSGEAAGAWLFRIARNCAADYFRRRRQEVCSICSSTPTILITCWRIRRRRPRCSVRNALFCSRS